MGVRIQRPGEPGHPGGNRKIYVRVDYQGHRKTRTFTTKKGSEDYAATVEALLTLGKTEDVFAEPTPPPPPTPPPTFKEITERWWTVDGMSLKAGTRDSYRNILDKHLLPTFGPRPIADITSTELEGWWAGLRAGRRSHKSLGNIRGVLSGIFRRGVIIGVLPRNPVEAIRNRLGQEDRELRQAEWLTEAELTRFLAVAAEREPHHYPFFLIIASTGLRAGEAMGLQVGDVDLGRCRLAIRRAIRKHRVGSPKSGKPRTVDVPPSTVAVIRRWIDVVRAEAAVRGEEATWLFPSRTGRPMEERFALKAFRRALTGAGIERRIRLHDLRHTYASLVLQRGVPLLVVSRQLGHASIAITADVYGHLAPEATRAAADALEAILTTPGRNPGATPAVNLA
jgi:integrase